MASDGWAARGALCLPLAAMLAVAPGRAQPVPDAQQIIEALKPSQTRSLRNLIVRKQDGEAAVASPTAPPASIDLTIQFDFDSASIRAESRSLLLSLSEALQSPALQSHRFLIEGHTDAQGAPEHNLKLSLERADEVRRFLLATGVSSLRVNTTGLGATQLANPADPTASENRRVRIVNLQ